MVIKGGVTDSPSYTERTISVDELYVGFDNYIQSPIGSTGDGSFQDSVSGTKASH
jgi:hypothetical protein